MHASALSMDGPNIAWLTTTTASVANRAAGQRLTVKVLMRVRDADSCRLEDIVRFMVRCRFDAGCKLPLLDLLILFQQLLVLFRLFTKVIH